MSDHVADLRAEVEALRAELAAARRNLHEAWLALRALRKEVELRSGAVKASEHTGPTFAEEAEAIARGVIAIYERAVAAEEKRGEGA